MLDGMFSFVLLDESVTPSRIIAARDPIGITTLYQGWNSKKPGASYFASELKALVDECDDIISFPPGHVYDSITGKRERYYNPSWWDTEVGPIPTKPADLTLLREALEAAVRKRLMSEVPYGVLLSGGLDSSLIAAIAARETEKVAQAQYEFRKRKLAEARSGPPTPRGEIDEFRAFFISICSWLYIDMPCSNSGLMAAITLILDWSRELTRSPRSSENSALPRNSSSRIRLYRSRGSGCHS